MAGMDGETLTLALFGREEGRYKVPDGLRKAVEKAGGEVAEEARSSRGSCRAGCRRGRASSASSSTTPARRRSSPRSATASSGCCASSRSSRSSTGRARRSASRRSRRRARPRPSARPGRSPTPSSPATSRARRARSSSCAPRASGSPGLLYQIVRRLRDALAVAEALASGQPPAQARRSLRMPPKAAERFIADVAKRDVDAFRHALEVLADLELESRGGGAERRRAQRGDAGRPGAAGRDDRGRARVAQRRTRTLGGVAARSFAARDFLRAPVFRCSAPRLTALSIVRTSCGARSWRSRRRRRDGGLEAAEVRLDRRRVAAVLEPLTLGAQDALFWE